jgi:hypothetical protein
MNEEHHRYTTVLDALVVLHCSHCPLYFHQFPASRPLWHLRYAQISTQPLRSVQTSSFVWEMYLHFNRSRRIGAGHSGRAVFACSNTGIVSSNPTQGKSVCLSVWVYSVFVL